MFCFLIFFMHEYQFFPKLTKLQRVACAWHLCLDTVIFIGVNAHAVVFTMNVLGVDSSWLLWSDETRCRQTNPYVLSTTKLFNLLWNLCFLTSLINEAVDWQLLKPKAFQLWFLTQKSEKAAMSCQFVYLKIIQTFLPVRNKIRNSLGQ